MATAPGGGRGRASVQTLHARGRRRPDRCDLHHSAPLAAAPRQRLARVTNNRGSPRPRPMRVAVQMDPLDKINIAGDSTFALMLKAQERGYELFYYLAEDLTWQDGRLYAGVRKVAVQAVAGDHFRLGEFAILDLGRDVDVVLMRQDPPFDLGYITATHLLERIQGETLVVKDPAAVRNAPEKIWVLDFARFMPPTLISRSLALAREFLAEHKEIVVKPLHGFAGGSVFRIGSDGANLPPLIELDRKTQ